MLAAASRIYEVCEKLWNHSNVEARRMPIGPPELSNISCPKRCGSKLTRITAETGDAEYRCANCGWE